MSFSKKKKKKTQALMLKMGSNPSDICKHSEFRGQKSIFWGKKDEKNETCIDYGFKVHSKPKSMGKSNWKDGMGMCRIKQSRLPKFGWFALLGNALWSIMRLKRLNMDTLIVVAIFIMIGKIRRLIRWMIGVFQRFRKLVAISGIKREKQENLIKKKWYVLVNKGTFRSIRVSLKVRKMRWSIIFRRPYFDGWLERWSIIVGKIDRKAVLLSLFCVSAAARGCVCYHPIQKGLR